MSTGTAARVADIYARSLLDLALQSEVLETVAADLDAVSNLLTQVRDFQAFLGSPYFAEQTRQDLVRQVFAGKLHRLTLNFLLVMIEHNRGALLPRIIDRFQQLYREHQGYRTVHVTVARTIGKEQMEKLARELAEALNAKVDLDVHVDSSVLGGIIIRYDEEMLDNSVRGRLARTVNELTNPQKRQKVGL
jgi:F-type H+-transporting ATPase subunit delta